MTPEAIRILLVDDDEDDFVMTRDLLADCLAGRFHLDWASDYESGVAQLNRQAHDVCLCDFRLGGRTGLEFLSEARRLGNHLPIIMLTGQGDHDVDMAATQAGAADYLLKAGLEAGALERAIRYALAHQRSEEALRQQLARINLLNRITRAVAERQDMRSIFQVALVHLEEHLRVAFGAVFLYQGDKMSLIALGPASQKLMTGIGIGEGMELRIADTCMAPCARGEIVRLEELRPHGLCAALQQAGLASLVALPLSAENQVIATMVLGRAHAQAFDPAEIEFFRALGEHISLAARHAKLHSDLQQAYDQLKESQQTAVRQERLAAVGQLAAGVAHEFNNILTVIQGYSNLLLASEKLGRTAENALRNIAAGSERAARLVSQLLAFGRKQIMQLQPLDINEVVGNVANMLSRILEENIHLRYSLAPALPPVHGDASMLEQVIMNLAVNARDAMPKGGALRISTALIHVDPEAARRQTDARPGQYVCLTVTDTGCGMDATTLGRLFEPFFTTKDVGKGTGLGLATAYGLIKQHHGWIEVESRPQHGATFRIFVPALNPEAVAAKAPQTMVASGGRETILVVEDEPHLRSMVREILETYGYGVLEAEDGPAALKTWQLGGKPIDLLLTDLVMPSGMSGEELAARLRQQQPSLKVVYTSGYSVELAGRGLGGQSDFHFLQKPYRPEILAKTIRECLDRPGKDAAGPAS